MEDLVAFANARGDNEAVLEYLMQHPQVGAVWWRLTMNL